MNLFNPLNLRHALRFVFVMIFMLLLVACQGEEEKETYTVGIVNLTSSLDSTVEGFKDGLEELGYVEGKNITYIYDGPVNSIDGLGAAVDKLLEEDVDLLFAVSTPAALAAQNAVAGTDIPVLFAPINDPVASGLVESLAQPGGNLTGIQVGGFLPKEFEWLLTLDPSIETVFSPYNPDDQSAVLGSTVLGEQAAASGITVVAPEVGSADDVVAAIADMPDSVDAIFLATDSMVLSQVAAFTEAAAERGLPLASINQAQAEAGALMGYGPEFYPVGEQAARLADQILGGIPPSDLPVETAEFFFSVNMKTANEIGLEIPNGILQQATHIVR